jgi:Uma2 family endonuclease
MVRKRSEYFDAGVGSFWIVDPEARSIAVYDHRDAETPRLFQESDVIEMTEILPGFRLSLAELFGELDEEAPEAP